MYESIAHIVWIVMTVDVRFKNSRLGPLSPGGDLGTTHSAVGGKVVASLLT